jgi:hypothetical protein
MLAEGHRRSRRKAALTRPSTIAAGVRPASAECGRTSLKSRRQSASTRRACRMELNSVSFKHSSRSLPMKLSTKAFCCGLPGAM